jgi:hypothetical protein
MKIGKDIIALGATSHLHFLITNINNTNITAVRTSELGMTLK